MVFLAFQWPKFESIILIKFKLLLVQLLFPSFALAIGSNPFVICEHPFSLLMGKVASRVSLIFQP